MRYIRSPGLLLLLVSLLVAGLPRVVDLGLFMTGDEFLWLGRSQKFLLALVDRDWARTYQTGHPGVTTMWAGSIGLWLHSVVAPAANFSALRLPIRWDSPVVATLLPFARLPVAIITTLCIVLSIQLIRLLLGNLAAWLSVPLLALDPFYLAHSRVIHHDALLASFALVSSLSLLLFVLHRRASGYLLLAGIAAALALLSKSLALLFVPFWGATFLLLLQTKTRLVSRLVLSATACMLWAVLAGLMVYDLWPAMWGDPLRILSRIWRTAEMYSITPHSQGLYFLGNAVDDPGGFFYGLTILFAVTPVILLGIILSLAFFLPKSLMERSSFDRTSRLTVILLLSYAIGYLVLLSLGAKKQGRYVLPAVLLIDVIAAWGLARAISWYSQSCARMFTMHRPPHPALLGAGCILIVQAAISLPHHPYYLTYYNPLWGGGRIAAQLLTVGWGEGLDQAAAFLNAKADASELTVTTWPAGPFAPYFRGKTLGMPSAREQDKKLVDYAVIYISGLQRNYPSAQFYRTARTRGILEKVIQLHGIDYVWIYRMKAATLSAGFDSDKTPATELVDN